MQLELCYLLDRLFGFRPFLNRNYNLLERLGKSNGMNLLEIVDYDNW
jgi:hypothetical protein